MPAHVVPAVNADFMPGVSDRTNFCFKILADHRGREQSSVEHGLRSIKRHGFGAQHFSEKTFLREHPPDSAARTIGPKRKEKAGFETGFFKKV